MTTPCHKPEKTWKDKEYRWNFHGTQTMSQCQGEFRSGQRSGSGRLMVREGGGLFGSWEVRLLCWAILFEEKPKKPGKQHDLTWGKMTPRNLFEVCAVPLQSVGSGWDASARGGVGVSRARANGCLAASQHFPAVGSCLSHEKTACSEIHEGQTNPIEWNSLPEILRRWES